MAHSTGTEAIDGRSLIGPCKPSTKRSSSCPHHLLQRDLTKARYGVMAEYLVGLRRDEGVLYAPNQAIGALAT
jgi:hypothetical protein